MENDWSSAVSFDSSIETRAMFIYEKERDQSSQDILNEFELTFCFLKVFCIFFWLTNKHLVIASVRSCATTRGRRYCDSSFDVAAKSCSIIEDTVDRGVGIGWGGWDTTRWPTNVGVLAVDDCFFWIGSSSSPSLDESISSSSSSKDRTVAFSLLWCFRCLLFEALTCFWGRLLGLFVSRQGQMRD